MYKILLCGAALLITACSNVIPIHYKHGNHEYSINKFEVIALDCKNCGELLNYKFRDAINTVSDFSSVEKEYIVNVSMEIKNERSGIRINSMSTRNKIIILLNYDIIEAKTNNKIYSNSIMEIDSGLVANSPFEDFTSTETIAVQLMQQSIDTLKVRLIIDFLQNKHLIQKERK